MNISSISFTALVAFGIGLVGGFIFNGNRLEAKYNAEKLALMESIKEKEKSLIATNESLQTQLKKDKTNYEKTIANLKHDISASKLRYYADVRVSDNSPIGYRKERAELDTTLAQSLIDITADGDKAIQQLNYCIEAYESIRKND